MLRRTKWALKYKLNIFLLVYPESRWGPIGNLFLPGKGKSSLDASLTIYVVFAAAL